jgi:hypothetical protein
MSRAKKITADEIIVCNPCSSYTHDQIHKIVGKGVTPLVLAKMGKVSLSHRRWVLTNVLARRPGGFRQLITWACDAASGARKHVGASHLDTFDIAIATTLAYLDGSVPIEDVREARAASAASSAYASSAYAAAAAASDAYSASASASDAAAYSAYAASSASASDAEEQKQLIALAGYFEVP